MSLHTRLIRCRIIFIYAFFVSLLSINVLQTKLIPVPTEREIFEWNMIRDITAVSIGGAMPKIPSKTRNLSTRRIKSLQSIDQVVSRRKTTAQSTLAEETINYLETISKESKLYNCLTREYNIKVTDNFTQLNNSSPNSYLFDINNMVKEIESSEEPKKQADKNVKKVTSKVLKDTNKIPAELIQKNFEEELSLTSVEKRKIDGLVFYFSFFM